MTMFWKTGLAALAVLTLGMATASAQDKDLDAKIYRLGDVSGFATERPTDGADSDTVLVRGGGHGGGHGGHGGGHFHGGGFHSASFHHSSHFHSFHSGHFHNRSFVSFGFGFGYPFYGSGYGYGYYPYYYSSPSYYYYPSYCYYPVSLSSAPVYSGSVGVTYPPAGSATVPPMRRADENFNVPSYPPEEQGTFPYNGGPNAPVPLPGTAPIPQKSAPIDPALGRVVSVPAKLPKYTYSAYGQKPVDTNPADRTVVVKSDATGR
jgi:hypothetical protein